MAGNPSVNFGQSESGLFSPEEIARLMESEFRRSQRYGYALSVLCAEIDRLESLHDLYGVESERRIQQAVASLLRTSTRASDVMGAARGQRLLVLLPHTPREGASAVARRLLAGCRELEFRGDGRSLRASLSIGIAVRGEEDDLARLALLAEQALRAALAAGGDRFVVHEHGQPPAAPARAPAFRAPEIRPAVPSRARSAPAPPPLPAVHELAGTTLEDKVRHLLRLAGGAGGLEELESEVLAILRQTLGEARRPHATREDVLAEVRALEARIAQQRRLLDASEEELARMIQEKSVDPGVASLYRTVQGLDPSEQNYKHKKELLAVIYRANVELLRQLEQELGQGPRA
jgi:diguanylate cyclase (GGDEF)-like protein